MWLTVEQDRKVVQLLLAQVHAVVPWKALPLKGQILDLRAQCCSTKLHTAWAFNCVSLFSNILHKLGSTIL